MLYYNSRDNINCNYTLTSTPVQEPYLVLQNNFPKLQHSNPDIKPKANYTHKLSLHLFKYANIYYLKLTHLLICKLVTRHPTTHYLYSVL